MFFSKIAFKRFSTELAASCAGWQLGLVDYCGVVDVKPLLHLDLAESSADEELANCVSAASGLVAGFLKVEGLSIPSIVPQLVKDACANFAAWAYRRVRDPAGAEGFWSDAEKFLLTYIDAESEEYLGSV